MLELTIRGVTADEFIDHLETLLRAMRPKMSVVEDQPPAPLVLDPEGFLGKSAPATSAVPTGYGPPMELHGSGVALNDKGEPGDYAKEFVGYPPGSFPGLGSLLTPEQQLAEIALVPAKPTRTRRTKAAIAAERAAAEHAAGLAAAEKIMAAMIAPADTADNTADMFETKTDEELASEDDPFTPSAAPAIVYDTAAVLAAFNEAAAKADLLRAKGVLKSLLDGFAAKSVSDLTPEQCKSCVEALMFSPLLRAAA